MYIVYIWCDEKLWIFFAAFNFYRLYKLNDDNNNQ